MFFFTLMDYHILIYFSLRKFNGKILLRAISVVKGFVWRNMRVSDSEDPVT